MKTLFNLKKVKKIILTLILSVLFFGISSTFAAQPDTFTVIVDPATFDVNEAVDLTIKAVKSDGSIVKDYQGMVMIEFDEVLEDDVAELPADLYTFTTEDQGVKTWSKGLKIREKGTYHLKVWDLQDDNIIGEQVIIVGDGGGNNENLKGTAEILSPMSGETVSTQDVNILGKSDITNTNVQFFLNGQQLEDETKTDMNGNFSIFIKNVKEGENKLFVRLVNIKGELLAESEEISFLYQPASIDDQFKGLSISPSKEINKGDQAKFDVKVGDNINSVELKIGDGGDLIGIFPMDKIDNNNWTKTVTIDNDGQHSISVTLIMQGGERKSYNGIDAIKVNSDRTKPNNGNLNNNNSNKSTISNLKVVRDGVVKSQMTVSRDSSGNPYSYEVRYGDQRSNLINSQKTAAKEIVIGNLDPNKNYYVQILALDQDGNIIGQPSDVVGTSIGQYPSAGEGSCSVGGIDVSTIRVGNQYYLTWGVVPGATKYIISRSTGPSNLQKIGETSDTKYQYPFNPNISKTYAYYSVTAVCNDGQRLQIGGAKKVVVGPKENFIIILLISILLYLGYKKFIKI